MSNTLQHSGRSAAITHATNSLLSMAVNAKTAKSLGIEVQPMRKFALSQNSKSLPAGSNFSERTLIIRGIVTA
jgi:hypothetical protein